MLPNKWRKPTVQGLVPTMSHDSWYPEANLLTWSTVSHHELKGYLWSKKLYVAWHLYIFREDCGGVAINAGTQGSFLTLVAAAGGSYGRSADRTDTSWKRSLPLPLTLTLLLSCKAWSAYPYFTKYFCFDHTHTCVSWRLSILANTCNVSQNSDCSFLLMHPNPCLHRWDQGLHQSQIPGYEDDSPWRVFLKGSHSSHDDGNNRH